MALYERDWRGDMQAVSEAIDEDLGAEFVTLIPMAIAANVNAGNIPDKSRNRVDVKAIYSHRSELIDSAGQLKFTTGNPLFSIRYSELSAWTPRQGDLIRLHRTGEQFEIVKAEPDGVSRVKLDVMIMGRRDERP